MRYLQLMVVMAALLAMPLSYVNAQEEDLDESDFSSTTANVFKVDENNNYQDNLALREARKVGLGLSAGGALGLYGLNVEINFEDINGAVVGVGGGDGYSTVNLAWKHVFLGDTVAPYTTLGFAHWYDSSGGDAYKNSSVLERVLTDSEKSSGRFAVDFISGAVGLQYTQLQGNLAGTSLYAEIVLLGDVTHGELVPTGAVGAGYYF
ncbi:hypothetical protein [Bdellovibrio sp. HCB337]|uniref:hypothetical protein n=1 Tax=Bdellovibrio sp. HCB337 TaxID=3394358 RepID=UPI0039A6E159